MLANMGNSLFILSLISLFNFPATIATNTLYDHEHSNLETYIVHVEPPRIRMMTESSDHLNSWYQSFLPANTLHSRMVHTYHNVITGFAARLTSDEVKEMEKKEGFVLARPQKILSLHTTHTPEFLGLNQSLDFGLWNASNLGEGVIIGVLDSGVTPTHPSFYDQGMSPPPAKWKGQCDFATNLCNNKLIGARTFVRTRPFDLNGHGTHTASTAAGNFVNGANVLGTARGTSAGVAPRAHLAIYKVCTLKGCADGDILAGIDAAIDEGVDVLSISLGGPPNPYFFDVVALGAFAATRKGIFVSCSAGNSGPTASSMENEAPWILTVAASTLDRTIKATAKLGNGEEFDGESLSQATFPSTLLPLVDASSFGAGTCTKGSMSGTNVTGKVVMCHSGGGIGVITKGRTVRNAGGAAMIIVNDMLDGYTIMAETHVLPATTISNAAGLGIKTYINSTTNPTATILFKGTTIESNNAPMVASFSSRGPSHTSPGILKPDITGPGVNILAAWPVPLTKDVPPSSLTFNIISGTSMSCPHLSGIAALLKGVHPDWSPAVIKSAIMTTADLVNLDDKPILNEKLLPADMFAIGAGHVNPSKANDPGLVYDIQVDEYINYMCGLGYTDTQVRIIARGPVNCASLSKISEAQLNYPSFSIELAVGEQETYTRTVTNVGPAESSYSVEVTSPPGVSVSVEPSELHFSENQKMTYQVTFNRTGGDMANSYVQGYLKLVSLDHVVTSPLSVKLV